MFSDPSLWMCRLLFVGLVVEACEIFKLLHSFDTKGMFSTATVSIMTGRSRWQLIMSALFGNKFPIAFAMTIQALAAITVIIEGLHTRAGILAALICLVTNAFLRSRKQIGGSGAEQLTFIVLVTFGLVLLAGGTDDARHIGDYFIAGQVVLAYVASGIAKAVSPIWRNGGAMAGILSTGGYGTPGLARLLSAHPKLDWLLCWSVIGWEIAFPLALFVPKPAMLTILGIGILFHASCAFLMGLNSFVWAFCGCYPAIWTTALLFRRA